MDSTNNNFELRCPSCSWLTNCGPAQMVEQLRKHRLLRPQADIDATLINELFRVSAEKFNCPQCGRRGLITTPGEPLDEDEWGLARRCSHCDTVIPAERLEVFPEATLCAKCQSRDERGELDGAEGYCPRCGDAMILRPSSRGGITRWLMHCPSCGRGT